jgi:hypothetical protein
MEALLWAGPGGGLAALDIPYLDLTRLPAAECVRTLDDYAEGATRSVDGSSWDWLAPRTGTPTRLRLSVVGRGGR